MSHPRRLLPSTAALAALEAVARHQSFTAAAQELALTQGAVSRQIAQLEALFGQPLFLRSSRHVEFTSEGRIYAEAIGASLQQIRQASVRLMTGSGQNVLRLAVLPTFGTRWLMPRIPAFLKAHPGLTLDLVSRIGQFDLRAEGVDVAIQHGSMDWLGGECTKLMDEVLVPVVSPGLLQPSPLPSPEQIARLPLLHLHSRPGAWAAWFRMHGLPPPRGPEMRFEHFSTAAQACIGGLGCALMPALLIREELAAGAMVAVGPPVRVDTAYFLVQPAGAHSDMPGGRFRQWILQELASEAPGRSGGPEAAAGSGRGEAG